MGKIIELKQEKNLPDIIDLAKHLYPNKETYIQGNENRFKRIFRLNIPEAKIFGLMENQKLIGHVSLIPNSKLSYEGCKKMGTIGFYECIEDKNASLKLLNHAQDYAKQIGCDYLVGPMDYATWYDYRFAHKTDYPEIANEPYNRYYYPSQFLDFGFNDIAQFLSNYLDEPIYDERWKKIQARMDKMGVKISHPDFSDPDLLKKLYPVEKEAWKYQFLYMDIPQEEYLLLRSKLSKSLDIEHSYICTHPEYGICGFIYSYPETMNPELNAIELKSIGILNKRELAGLGVLMVTLYYKEVFKKYRRSIHTLMRSDNFSANYMTDKMVVARKYSLYGKKI